MIAVRQERKERAVPLNLHREMVRLLCDRLESFLLQAGQFDLTAEGDHLQFRVEGVTGREFLDAIRV